VLQYDGTELQSESSESEQSDSEHDVVDKNCYVSGMTEWVPNGRKMVRFPEKYDAGSNSFVIYKKHNGI
jgi:hypothetical protein